MMRVLFSLMALLALSACAPTVAEVRRFDLIVQNQCTGPNQTVFFYIPHSAPPSLQEVISLCPQ
jgi:uncharacterized lipoprotein YmbA